MGAQLRLLQAAPSLHGERKLLGVIVHRRAQLDPSLQPTEHEDILRATVQRLPDLLLARHLPGPSERAGMRTLSPTAPAKRL